MIELGIKSWVRKSLVNPNFGLPITPQSFTEKEFFTIYVRSPKNEEAKAVAIKFLYKEGYIYIKNVMRDTQEIRKQFKFLKQRRNLTQNVLKISDNSQSSLLQKAAKVLIEN
ncbi:hypothetical protein [Gloeothece verrucosa]|uniref:Uncharacterized protein n=1 Tax=Gloeothece verrucosa (strain PCC 7822) TaxID=497965 RepID=E0U7P9_GLOV7|nr:hypothetical protein [Gloeothece verrucosa]ADN14861.1 conserved hypothetical protein [Gloeothece verrucosa PCC 7822]